MKVKKGILIEGSEISNYTHFQIDSIKDKLIKEVGKDEMETPWFDEPDFVQFDFTNKEVVIETFSERNVPSIVVKPGRTVKCVIKRIPFSGSLCGYVGFKEESPIWTRTYENTNFLLSQSPHGGLTFSDFMEPESKENVSHKEGPLFFNENGDIKDKMWFFGFDCAHHGDFSPSNLLGKIMANINRNGTMSRDFGFMGTYKDLAYVQGEVISLARELIKVEAALDIWI